MKRVLTKSAALAWLSNAWDLRSTDKRAAKSIRAFSLIEFIGVLAILAILATALIPVVIRRMDQAARTREISDLAAISNALTLQILRSNTVPSGGTWVDDAANWTRLSASAINKNPRGYYRVLFIDTNGWLGTVALPYTQTVQGTANASNQARMMIVSCLSGTNGVSQSSGALPSHLFNDIWNTPQGSKPSTWAGWRGDPDDLLVQRINLQPLFHRVILFNPISNAVCAFSINSSTTAPVSNKVASYYLEGSVLGLYTNTTLQLTELITKDLSRLYQGPFWSDEPGPGPPSIQTNLENLAYAFVNSPSPPASKRGDNTYGVADTLVAYMSAYSSWANMSPCFSFLGQGNTKFVPEATLISTVLGCFSNPGNGSCQMVPP